MTKDKQSFAAGNYALDLDGVVAGWLHSFEGGGATGDVVVEDVGPDTVARKHLARVRYEEIVLTCGAGMTSHFFGCIKAVLERDARTKNGAVISADHRRQEQARLEFTNALITEIGFPALDAASKDTARLTLKLSPESTRRSRAPGGMIGDATADRRQKNWLVSNFRLKIDGLDCSRVSKIDALVVKQQVLEDAVGEHREYLKAPAQLEIPNLAFTTAQSHAQDLQAWHEDFVIKGANNEKGGSLEFLTPDLKEVLFTLTFRNLGIFRFAPEKSTPGSEAIGGVRAEMYCEELGFGSYEKARA